jgi:serine/threonine protein kinase
VAIKEYLPGSLATRGAGTQVEVRLAEKRELFVKGMLRFVNEAHLLAKFRHPALVSVMRFIETNGTAYMVMPYYRGETLREKVRGGYRVKSSEDLFGFLLPVLEGLTQIHSVACYHLDISSDNILILENGAPVLLDFGAARHTELSGEDPTTIILKPGFAPIEQYSIDNEELKIGPWTDIYAIAAVAYLLVSGVMPPVAVGRIMKDSLKTLTPYATPELPADVLKAVDAALAVKPQDRPQTVRAFVQSLLSAADGFVPPGQDTGTESDPLYAHFVNHPGISTATATMSSATTMPPSARPRAGGAGRGAVLRWSVLFVVLLVFAGVVFAIKGDNHPDDSRPRANPEEAGENSGDPPVPPMRRRR